MPVLLNYLWSRHFRAIFRCLLYNVNSRGVSDCYCNDEASSRCQALEILRRFLRKKWKPPDLQAVELFSTSFWKCFLGGFFFPPPTVFKISLSFRIGMSLGGRTTAFKRELPDFKWRFASLWNCIWTVVAWCSALKHQVLAADFCHTRTAATDESCGLSHKREGCLIS